MIPLVQSSGIQRCIYRENPDRDHKGAVNSVDIHPSDTLCVSGSGDKSIRVWNFENDSTQGF